MRPAGSLLAPLPNPPHPHPPPLPPAASREQEAGRCDRVCDPSSDGQTGPG